MDLGRIERGNFLLQARHLPVDKQPAGSILLKLGKDSGEGAPPFADQGGAKQAASPSMDRKQLPGNLFRALGVDYL